MLPRQELRDRRPARAACPSAVDRARDDRPRQGAGVSACTWPEAPWSSWSRSCPWTVAVKPVQRSAASQGLARAVSASGSAILFMARKRLIGLSGQCRGACQSLDVGLGGGVAPQGLQIGLAQLKQRGPAFEDGNLGELAALTALFRLAQRGFGGRQKVGLDAARLRPCVEPLLVGAVQRNEPIAMDGIALLRDRVELRARCVCSLDSSRTASTAPRPRPGIRHRRRPR